jgi:hypothetical protein
MTRITPGTLVWMILLALVVGAACAASPARAAEPNAAPAGVAPGAGPVAATSPAAPPRATQPAGSQPTTNPATEKGPWADAKVGTTVKVTLAGEAAETLEVVKADANAVTLRTSVSISGVKPTEGETPRRYTPDELAQRLQAWGKRLADETIRVAGKDLKCEVYEKEMSPVGKKVAMKTWLCREVPGWVVRVDNNASGETKTIYLVVEFKP